MNHHKIMLRHLIQKQKKNNLRQTNILVKPQLGLNKVNKLKQLKRQLSNQVKKKIV